MEKLIPVINKLQDVFNTVGRESIQLPQIAVVGTQSTGKSSVLENLVGRDFLPRGAGIVTRRPLVLQLVHINAEDSESQWGWGKFLHTAERKFFDFAEIRDEIASETEKVAGANRGISSDPIRLRIFSPHVLNLTLIDLPGITRVPVGDQPEDIEKRIREMIEQYISNPKCIILAVHAANTDLATSEALKLAREIDPEGKRTLAVCTKLDIMDEGTDAVDLLTGKIIPVKLGIIGVVNRSQQDIIDCKSIEEALRDEEVFLRQHYPVLAGRNGSKYLAQTLNRLLMQHIRDTLPVLRHEISSKLSIYESQLQELGEPIKEKGPALLQVLTKFASNYCHKIEGTSRDIETHQLSGGARICYIFHHIFSETLGTIAPLEGLQRSDILHAISNAMGPRPALFVSEMAFELLVKRQIRLLLQPSLQCVELVYEELQRIIQYCLSHIREFQRFPTLREQMNTVVMGLLRERLPLTNQMVENLIRIELAYINTNHPDFVGGTRAAYEAYMVAQTVKVGGSGVVEPHATGSKTGLQVDVPSAQPGFQRNLSSLSGPQGKGWLSSMLSGRTTKTSESGSSTDAAAPVVEGLNDLSMDRIDLRYLADTQPGAAINRQQFDCELIEKLIRSYFVIVRQSIQDSVPKAVMHCLVNFVKDDLQHRLVSELYRIESYDALMDESEEIFTRRREIGEMVKALQKAAEILSEIRDLQFESKYVGFSDYEY
ncbi:Dynamin-1-like protein [Geodia barretti]|uniref:dynamin GTPase n=1 Tax=Geodia barretti TaxID=519541 RepID=A0AA35WTE4_GEOBA|nr:Dynamin-1-like protein [Geodia barretti]